MIKAPTLYMTDQADESRELLYKLVLFIICPFAAFLLSLHRAGSRSSYVIYALFGVLFCWHMNPTGVERYDDLSGILARIAMFEYTTPYDSLGEELIAYFTFADNSPKELYMDLLIYISHIFSDNPHLTMAIAAIPWLFFQLKSLKLITDDRRFKNGSLCCLIILLLFVLPRDIISVQNPRFTTATWMCVYATIQLFLTRKYKYLILILLLPLIHSAFWVYVGLMVIGFIALRFPKLCIVLFYLSIPFSYLSYDILSQVNFNTLPIPPVFQNWISRYMSEESYHKFVLHTGASGFFWVGVIFNTLMHIAYIILPLMIWRAKASISKKEGIYRLLVFYIFFCAVVNFVQPVPVLGERYFWIVRILSVFLFFKLMPKNFNVILFVLFSCSYDIFRRYFYTGAIYSSVPLEIFFMPLPWLIYDFWGMTPKEVMKNLASFPT